MVTFLGLFISKSIVSKYEAKSKTSCKHVIIYISLNGNFIVENFCRLRIESIFYQLTINN